MKALIAVLLLSTLSVMAEPYSLSEIGNDKKMKIKVTYPKGYKKKSNKSKKVKKSKKETKTVKSPTITTTDKIPVISTTEKHMCPECEGKKRLYYGSSKFYSSCKLCKGKGEVSLGDVKKNKKYKLIVITPKRGSVSSNYNEKIVYFYTKSMSFYIRYDVKNSGSRELKSGLRRSRW